MPHSKGKGVLVGALHHMTEAEIIREFIRSGKGRHWFDREAQKQHIFQIATRLFIEYEHEPLEAIEKAEDFVNEYFNAKIAPGAKK